MIAFKGFTEDLTANRGKGIYQYELGKTYIEEKSKTRSTGFHCAEYILDCMTWYEMDGKNRFFSVKAEGSIDEESGCSMVVCTKMTLLRELTVKEIAGYAMMYIVKHPLRDWEKQTQNISVLRNEAKSTKENGIAIARGTNPKVKGAKGSVLGLILESESGEIQSAKVFEVGKDARENTWYTLTEERELKEL